MERLPMGSVKKRVGLPLIALSVATAALACCHSAGSQAAGDPNVDGNKIGTGAASGGNSLGDGVLSPGDPGVVDVTFEIRADRDARAISPMIYGVNYDIRD